jgi:hypothetical protein
MDKKLRLFAAEVVVASKLSKPAKIQMLEFIQKEATDAQVKALLLDGKIVKLDEQAEQIVNNRFEVSEAGGRVAKLRKSYMTQYGSGGGVNPAWLLYRAARAQFDKCTRRCGTFELNTSRRQHCLIKCKVQKLQKELQGAKKAGDEKKAKQLQSQLAKAQQTLKKSQQSFTKRGVDEPK